MTRTKIKRNWRNVGISQTDNADIEKIVINYTKISAPISNEQEYAETKTDLGHPDLCERIQRDNRCKLFRCFYFHPEVNRDSQNRRDGNSNFRNGRKFGSIRKYQERRPPRYNNSQTYRNNSWRHSSCPKNRQTHPNNINIFYPNNKPFFGPQLSTKEMQKQIINVLGKIINNQRD